MVGAGDTGLKTEISMLQKRRAMRIAGKYIRAVSSRHRAEGDLGGGRRADVRVGRGRVVMRRHDRARVVLRSRHRRRRVVRGSAHLGLVRLSGGDRVDRGNVGARRRMSRRGWHVGGRRSIGRRVLGGLGHGADGRRHSNSRSVDDGRLRRADRDGRRAARHGDLRRRVDDRRGVVLSGRRHVRRRGRVRVRVRVRVRRRRRSGAAADARRA